MSAARRQPVPPPDMSGLSGANPLLSRFGADVPGPAPAARAVPPARRADAPPTMDRRSWYMSKAVADALAEEVDELHYATRRPKHEVLAALIAVAMEHRDEVRARLTEK